jgi:hypothetical protein
LVDSRTKGARDGATRRGFKIGEEEALMILDVQKLPPSLLAPARKVSPSERAKKDGSQ